MTRRAVIAATFAAGALGLAGGWWLAPITVATAAVASTWAQRRRAAAEQRRLARSVPLALDLLVLASAAGLSPHHTISLLHRSGPAPLQPAFGAVIDRTDRGDALADALAELPRRLGAPAVAATDALVIAQRHGAPLSDALAVIGTDAARQRRARAEAAARRLPVLLSFPLVCCVLPAFVLLGITPAVLAALRSITGTDW